jgi:hypothetical protein
MQRRGKRDGQFSSNGYSDTQRQACQAGTTSGNVYRAEEFEAQHDGTRTGTSTPYTPGKKSSPNVQELLHRLVAAERTSQCQVEDEMAYFSDMLQSFLSENQVADKEAQVYRSDILWFAKELDHSFHSLRQSSKAQHEKTNAVLDSFLGQREHHVVEEEHAPTHAKDTHSGVHSAPQGMQNRQQSSAPSTRQSSFSDIDGLSDDEDEDRCSHDKSDKSATKPNQHIPIEKIAPYSLDTAESELQHHAQLASLSEEVKCLQDQLCIKEREVRSQHIEMKLLNSSMGAMKRDLVTARKLMRESCQHSFSPKTTTSSPLSNKIVSAIADTSRDTSREIMRKQIIALATALEESESQRADLLQNLQKERTINEERLNTLKEAISRLELL